MKTLYIIVIVVIFLLLGLIIVIPLLLKKKEPAHCSETLKEINKKMEDIQVQLQSCKKEEKDLMVNINKLKEQFSLRTYL